MNILPNHIREEVENVLLNADNYLSAYQILERLPASLRDQIIEERGIPGYGNGNSYTAASVVTDAAEMLKGPETFTSVYCEGSGLNFEVSGRPVRPGNSACAFYRIRL